MVRCEPARRSRSAQVGLASWLLLCAVTLCACEPAEEEQRPDAGFYGRCIREGEAFEAKLGDCCAGLVGLEILQEGEPGRPDLPPGCTSDAPPSMQVCGACGNGVCGTGEDRCNCPSDCGT